MNGSFVQRLTRQPLVFDPGPAAEVCARFSDLGAALAGLLAATAGCSPYLGGLISREAAWLRPVLATAPEAALAQILDDVDPQSPTPGPALRRAKRRVALLTALADLGGVWSLDEVTGALTEFADFAVQHAVAALVGDEIRRGKLPGAVADDATNGAGMVVLAMGKMGARELNYSSDIDLICLFDETRYPGVETDARAAFIRVTRKMTALLSDQTDQGYVFRCDLRLRPDAAVMPVCLSMAVATRYYEAQGRTWERAAYIKARPCAGDLGAGARFLTALTPFVWRKHLDFAAIQDAHDMRLRIRDHRGLHGPISVEGHNLKLGVGGIREIEFFTQTRQLIAGGRDVRLRDATTAGGLRALAATGWVPPEVAETLIAHYRAHREVEHRLQMVGDAQTHDLPVTALGIARIASFCGQTEPAFRADMVQRLVAVDRLTEGFFSPAAVGDAPDLGEAARAIVAGWDAYPALRSDRAQAIFHRLRPVLLTRLARAANPDEALVALDGFLRGLPSGVQIFSLFEANPPLVDLIVDIAATAPSLAHFLARHSRVLDAVIGGAFFAPWPGRAALHAELSGNLAAATDYEARLDAARLWMKDLHFRIGVHHLRGLLDGYEAGKLYADLAGAVIAALWPVVVANFAARHGAPPGRGAVVFGMGSLGAGRLNAGSDLDLLVIYDAQGVDISTGTRPLPTRQYYARLTQAMVTALTAQLPSGRLYQVDMRLRPSGRQGPVATSLASFQSYQQTEAWSWEHLALTRARVVAGPADLAEAVETFRRTLLIQKGRAASLCADVADMRARLAAAKPGAKTGSGAWDAKFGAGHLMDVELLAQMLALMAGSPARGVEQQLAAGVNAALVSQTEKTALLDACTLCWRLQAASRLLSDLPLDPAGLGEGGRAFVLRETGQRQAKDLTAQLQRVTAAADQVIGAVLQRGGGQID